jgi:hypothetical protein
MDFLILKKVLKCRNAVVDGHVVSVHLLAYSIKEAAASF